MKQQDKMDQVVRNWLVAAAPEAPPIDLHGLAMERVADARQKVGWLHPAGAAWPAKRQLLAFVTGSIAISIAAIVVLALIRGALTNEPAATPLVPYETPTAAPSPAPSSPALEPTREHEALDAIVPFTYLAPAPLDIEGHRVSEHVYELVTLNVGGGGHIIVARIDGAAADDCARPGLAGAVPLPSGVDAILEVLHADPGMTFEKHDVALTRSGQTAYQLQTTTACIDHIHVDGRFPRVGTELHLADQSRSTWMVDVGGATVAIQAWATEDSRSEEWLPITDGIVRSIRFLEDSQAPVSTNSPEPSIAAIITPGVVPSFDPVVASEASDFSVPFQYLAPESLHLEGRAITSNYYLLLSREAGGGEMIVARIDGANSSDCPQRLAPGSVELPAGIEPILETLAAESGLSFERQEVTLDRSGRTAYELTTTADCESSSIEVDRELGIHGPQVELALWKTWILDIGEATILIQARPGFTAHELGGPDRSDEWLQSASQILGSMVFDSEASPAPERSPSVAWTDFNRYLDGYGQLFTPTAVPSEIADWSDSVTTLTHELGNPDQLTYGVVTCVNEALNCANRGLVRPGESLAIWLVEFSPVVGCPQWAAVDARSGEFINGSGPPC